MTYTLTDAETEELLQTFAAESYPAGAKGALTAASIAAGRRATRDGRPTLLTGPNCQPRRYDPPRLAQRPLRGTYRVKAVCGHWAWPLSKRDQQPERCWACRVAEGSERQKAAVREANARRKKERENGAEKL